MKQQRLSDAIVQFLNELCADRGVGAHIEIDTPLFETKILDSMRFVALMGFLEGDLGIDIPDERMSTEYFSTPRRIAENFSTLWAEA